MAFPGFARHERTGFELYGQAVAAARDPYLYLTLGVPDTLDGRFDMIGLHVFVLIQRLKRDPPPGPALAQAVFDAMFSDMDRNLRELGVGDMSIARQVRAMWEAFHGRASAYAAAMEAGGPAGMETGGAGALDAALRRNVWRGEPVPDDAVSAMRRLMLAQDAYLSGQAQTEFRRGKVRFLSAGEASA